MKKTFSTILLCAILFTACKNDDPTPAAKTKIYVVGYEKEENRDNLKAKYWINGAGIELVDGIAGSTAKTVFVSGNDVYILGQEDGYSKYWKNGKATMLSDKAYNTYANSIFVHGNDVYVAGTEKVDDKNIATLWKNGIPTALTDGTNSSYANSIYVSGTDVYITGGETSNNRYICCYWKNGVSTVLSDNTSYNNVTSIFVSDNNVYVSGEEYTGEYSVAKYWKNGMPIELSDGTNYNYTTSIFVNGNDVYVTGFEMNDYPPLMKAKCWKNGIEQELGCEAENSISSANSIYISDGDVYIAGNMGDDTTLKRAAYWKNGVLTILENKYSTANSIFVTK